MNCLPNYGCPKCNSDAWDWAYIGFTDAKQCTDCGEIYMEDMTRKPWVPPWNEITKGQIDSVSADCLKHKGDHGAGLYDFAWAIEAICKQNNGY